MKNCFIGAGAPLFSRALLCFFALFVLGACLPALAVRVWNVGENYEQPPGTPKGLPHLIVSGLHPDPSTLFGTRYLNVKVVASGSGKPVEGAMVYLVRRPEDQETVVFNSDHEGKTIIWGIADCYRKLVVCDGLVSVKQFVSMPAGCPTNVVVKLPYSCRISVPRPPFKCRDFIVWTWRFNEAQGCYDEVLYKGELGEKTFSAWVPPGIYQMFVDSDFERSGIRKCLFWAPVKVKSGDRLLVETRPRFRKW